MKLWEELDKLNTWSWEKSYTNFNNLDGLPDPLT
jgi:hypothetical protein